MPEALSPNIHEEIYEKVRNAFSDFGLFDQIVSKQLRQAIEDADHIEIDAKSLRKLTEKYFDVDSFKTDQQKLILQQIHLILRTTYVVILSYHENIKPLMWEDVQTLLDHYPQFQGQDEDELRYLLLFRNYLRIALIVIPARLNKQLLLKIAARLEGSKNEYITGGGQKPCVTRRVEIYEQEGNIQPEKRQDRIRPPPVPGKKRHANNPLKDLKLLRLPSEEVRNLTRAPTDPPPKGKGNKPNNNGSSSSRQRGGQGSGQSGSNGQSGGMNPMMDFFPPNHPFAHLPPIAYYPYPYPYYNPAAGGANGTNPMAPPMPLPPMNFMNFEPNFNNISQHFIPGGGASFDDSIVNDSMNDLFAFGTTPRASNNNSNGAVTNDGIPAVAAEDFFAMPTAPSSSSSHPVVKEENSASSSRVTAGGAGGPPSMILPSSTFAPGLNREQSELIDKLLLPDSEFWTLQTPREGITPGATNSNGAAAGGGANVSLPLQLMRDISWDIYNGTFESDLKNVFGNEW